MRNELFSMLGGMFLSGDAENGAIESRAVEVGGANYNYQIHVPAKLKNESNLPVVVFLHGIRERGTNGFLPETGVGANMMRHYFARVPAIILFPQCRPGKYWSDAEMEEMVIGALDATVEEFRADRKRVYLIGVSMGGYGAMFFAARHTGKFAALVSVCGGSPILSGDRFTLLAREIGATPAWLFHGADDRVVPVTESREIVAALKANGGNVRYNEYANVGHNVWLNVLSEKELLPWLLAQKIEQK